MSASAYAYLVAGVPFDKIGETFDHQKELKRFNPNTGEPLIVAYQQGGVRIMGEAIPDDPDPDPENTWQWVRRWDRDRFWEGGTYPSGHLTNFLLKLGWEVPPYEDEPERLRWSPQMFKIMGISAPKFSYQGSSYVRDAELSPESITELLSLAQRNFDKLKCPEPVRLYLLSELN